MVKPKTKPKSKSRPKPRIKTKVSIKKLYKIFGDDPQAMLQHVHDGVNKQDLLDTYGHVLGLRNINIDIPEGGVQVIMGLSGSGKSTLVRHINRLIQPTGGQVLVDGCDVVSMSDEELRDFRRHRASMVFQRFALLPHYTVMENVTYGLQIQNVDKEVAVERAANWIERVGLIGYEDCYPAQLSGGMQQRVGLARALATDADILLMDEAFSALDPLIRTDMQNILLMLQEELRKTIIFITHDLDEALRVGDNIAILRDGEVIQQGAPQNIILNPVDDYIYDFVKDINRGRVIRAGTIMDDTTDVPKRAATIDVRTALEDALPLLLESKKALVVKDDSPVGSITLDQAVRAMARPR